jgi:hypothetical protein
LSSVGTQARVELEGRIVGEEVDEAFLSPLVTAALKVVTCRSTSAGRPYAADLPAGRFRQ